MAHPCPRHFPCLRYIVSRCRDGCHRHVMPSLCRVVLSWHGHAVVGSGGAVVGSGRVVGGRGRSSGRWTWGDVMWCDRYPYPSLYKPRPMRTGTGFMQVGCRWTHFHPWVTRDEPYMHDPKNLGLGISANPMNGWNVTCCPWNTMSWDLGEELIKLD